MFKATINKNTIFEVSGSPEKRIIDQQDFIWDVVEVDINYFHILKDNQSYRAEIVSADFDTKVFIIKINGIKYEATIEDKYDLLLKKMGFNNNASVEVKDIKAPMPGLILDIKSREGSLVKKGDPLMILEAMKMENILKAPRDGVVKTIKVKVGDSVEKNQILLQF